MAKSPKAALFARYSSKLQDSLSLDAQVSEMERHWEKEGWEITHRFLLPETRSVHVEQAEEFQEMIKAARQRKFDILVLHKLDRFGRDRETTVLYKAMLRRHGIQIFSLTEKLGESAYERMVEGFLEVIAEFYSLNLAQETRKGQKAATRAGRWTGGKPPFGYQRGEDENGKSILVEEPAEAAVIRGVFERYVEGQPRKEIQAWIEEQTGKKWSAQTMLSRLSNPTYKGVLRYGVTSLSAKGKRTKKDPEQLVTGNCHAIVPAKLWERAQEIRESHQTRNRRASYPYLLTKGFMVCAECGTPVVGQFGGGKGYKYPYYVCPGWAKGTCERQNAARADALDEEVVAKFQKISRDFHLHRWTQIESAIDEEKQRLIQARGRALKESLEDIRQKKENLLEFVMASGAKQVGSVTRKLRDLEAEEEAVAERLVRLQVEEAARVREELETIEDWMVGLLPYLQDNPGSPTWTKAVRGMFGVFLDFKSRVAGIYLLRLYPDGKETLLQEINPAEGSLEGVNPRVRTIRSTQI